jgi:hypothetical protein
MVLLMSLIFGGISGYVAGVLVGGVFLVADAVRAAWRWRRNELLEAAAADTPLYSSLRAEQRESRNLVANGDSSVDEPPSG